MGGLPKLLPDKSKESMEELKEKLIVPYPSKPSECDIQLELMIGLRNLGYDVRSEVKLRTKDSFDTSHLRSARFDLVVYKDKVARVIIEVKRTDNGRAPAQAKHYEYLTGLPVVVCGGLVQVEPTISRIRTLVT